MAGKTGTTRRTKAENRSSTRAKSRVGKKAVVGYYSTDLSQALHSIAAKEGTKIQALLGEAIDMLLVNRGQVAFKER